MGRIIHLLLMCVTLFPIFMIIILICNWMDMFEQSELRGFVHFRYMFRSFIVHSTEGEAGVERVVKS